MGLPRITGFLLMGILTGPQALQLIPEADIRSLRFIDETALAFISYASGSKLILSRMKGRMKAIMYVTLGLVLFEYLVGTFLVVCLSNQIVFMKGMSQNQVLAVALMAGALIVARSPASAIAIVRETGTENLSFSRLVLGVTVVMDLVVIGIFAAASLFANALLANEVRSIYVTAVFFAQLGISINESSTTTRLIDPNPKQNKFSNEDRFDSSTRSLNIPQSFQKIISRILDTCIGFLAFAVGHRVQPYLQPLIICTVAGFVCVNFSNGNKHFLTMRIGLLHMYT
eukprot:GSMAST32.ASY1.ANO1.2081.1 assembled CDS